MIMALGVKKNETPVQSSTPVRPAQPGEPAVPAQSHGGIKFEKAPESTFKRQSDLSVPDDVKRAVDSTLKGEGLVVRGLTRTEKRRLAGQIRRYSTEKNYGLSLKLTVRSDENGKPVKDADGNESWTVAFKAVPEKRKVERKPKSA